MMLRPVPTARRTAAAAASVVLCGTLLAGCVGASDRPDRTPPRRTSPSATPGVADRSAPEIITASLETMSDLPTYRIRGRIVEDSRPFDLDLQLAATGDCVGTVTAEGGSSRLLRIGSSTWIKPDAAFWRLALGDRADRVIAAVGDRWYLVPPEDTSFTAYCDPDTVIGDWVSTVRVRKTGVRDLDGVRVVAFENTRPETDGDFRGYVRATGEPYLVRIVESGGQMQDVTFGDYGAPFTGVAPGPGEQITQAEIG